MASTEPFPFDNPRTRSKCWWKPLARGPQGGRFLEFVYLEPGSLPAAMVHWLWRKKTFGEQYSARELMARFKVNRNVASLFLQRSEAGGWGWVDWCEGIAGTGSTPRMTQTITHEYLTKFCQLELGQTGSTTKIP